MSDEIAKALTLPARFTTDEPRDSEAGPAKYFWSFIYFHGALEQITEQHTETAYDLVRCDMPVTDVSDGIYLVNVYGHPSMLFLWTAETGPASKIRRGLIVLQGAEPDVLYAMEKYYEKASIL